MGEWSDGVATHLSNTADVITLQTQARTRFNRAFNEYMNALLDDLYPLEDIERINQEILTIRAAYTRSNGELDCRGLATNPMIESSAIVLQENMEALLDKINT